GWQLCVTMDILPSLSPGCYYNFELEGCAVMDLDGRELGILASVYNYPANDIYEVRTKDGMTINIPAIKDVISKIDLGKKSMWVNKEFIRELL
ncbi:MAG: ribosome maturation factor RimM, partial [bacterium]